MKCPDCGIVTFDDLPECPRCKASFALVRPLATASLDGARHLLRDDPELRVKLRDRLHRARLDRRKQNENPLAAASDDDAPDWFVPLSGDDNGAAEAMSAATPATRGHSKETPIVHSDDPPPNDGERGEATTADREIDIEVAGPEPLTTNNDEPKFDGDIPGFTDWREELRERLKRIRARREEERLADGGDNEETETGADVDAPEADDVEADEPEADEEVAKQTEADEIDEANEADEEVAKQTEVVGFGAAIVAPPAAPGKIPAASEDDVMAIDEPAEIVAEQDVDIEPVEIVAEQDVDFTMEKQADDIVLDQDDDDLVDESAPDVGVDDPGAAEEAIAPAAEPDGEAEQAVESAAEPARQRGEEAENGDAADFDCGEAETEELEPFAAPDADDEPEISTGEAIERLDTIFDEPAEATEDLAGSVPELDFDEATPATPTPALDLDLPEADAADEKALEWDEEVVEPATEHSSAGPLGERAAAALCDLLVLTVIGAALVGAASSGTGLPFRQILVEEAVSLGIAWAIFVIGYSVFFVGSCGQTIGRMVMRLRVVGTDQFSVGFGRAAVRLAAWVVSALPLLAGMLPALRDPQRRGLHDRLSRTRVVKA